MMKILRIADDASKAVQKTPNRISLESMLAKVVSEEYINPPSIPHMTICVIVLKNAFSLIGTTAPADPTNYSDELGRRFSKEDAIRQMWPLEAYALRERLMVAA